MLGYAFLESTLHRVLLGFHAAKSELKRSYLVKGSVLFSLIT